MNKKSKFVCLIILISIFLVSIYAPVQGRQLNKKISGEESNIGKCTLTVSVVCPQFQVGMVGVPVKLKLDGSDVAQKNTNIVGMCKFRFLNEDKYTIIAGEGKNQDTKTWVVTENGINYVRFILQPDGRSHSKQIKISNLFQNIFNILYLRILNNLV